VGTAEVHYYNSDATPWSPKDFMGKSSVFLEQDVGTGIRGLRGLATLL